MSKKQESLAVIETAYPALNPTAEMREILAANLGNQTLEVGDLNKIRVPTGGGLAWELPGGEVAKSFEAIIIHWKMTRTFYKSPFTGGHERPDCSSDDCITGKGDPGGSCLDCPFAKFQSAAQFNPQKKNAQACSERRLAFALLPGNFLPVMISLGPSAIKGFKKFLLVDLGGQSIPFFGAVVRFSLVKEKSSDGIEFSLPKYELVSKLTPEQRDAVKAYAASLMPSLQQARDDDAIE